MFTSCDHSLPHLLNDCEIMLALSAFNQCLAPGGGCILTGRDYDAERQDGIQFSPNKIVTLMTEAGFKWVKIANCDYYQPVIIGTKNV